LLSATALFAASFADHAITPKKKTARASEQDRPDVLKRRQAWFESQFDLDPERLVFIDEIWASTNMARTHSRCRRGERLRVGVPHGDWKTTAFVAALTTRGMVAPFVLDGPINRPAFGTYVERVLAPELRQGDVVVMHNLSSGAESARRGSKRQAPVFSIFRPTADGLWTAIGRIVDLRPDECRNYFAAAGHDAT
jgi:DDE superfamily endonuclease